MPKPCPSCNKLASLETQEPEINSEDLTNGVVTIEARVVRNSECCDEEMKEYTFDLEQDFTEALEEHKKAKHAEMGDDEEPEYSLEVGDSEYTERTPMTDRKGKPIKNSRYATSYTGVSVNITITCDDCSETVVDTSLTDDVPNSNFDEL